MSPGKKREQELAEREKRERLAYVGTLAAGLVHEMRNPLHAVNLTAQSLIELTAGLPDTQRDRFEKRLLRVAHEVQTIIRTLDEFLLFARPPRPDPVPTDLNHFLRELLEFSEPEFAAAEIDLCPVLADDMYPVVLDKAQFTQVLLNLLRNAREACEEAGHGQGKITVSSREGADTVEILVEDNGIGIEPESEEKLFDLFYTTKEKGTGLGLGIVRRIVEEHGGTISAHDRADGGARFCISLPRGKFLEFTEDAAGGRSEKSA